MSNCSCFMTNDSAGGLLAGVFVTGGLFCTAMFQLCTIKTVIKNGKVYKNILDAPVYGTAAQKV